MGYTFYDLRFTISYSHLLPLKMVNIMARAAIMPPAMIQKSYGVPTMGLAWVGMERMAAISVKGKVLKASTVKVFII